MLPLALVDSLGGLLGVYDVIRAVRLRLHHAFFAALSHLGSLREYKAFPVSMDEQRGCRARGIAVLTGASGV